MCGLLDVSGRCKDGVHSDNKHGVQHTMRCGLYLVQVGQLALCSLRPCLDVSGGCKDGVHSDSKHGVQHAM